MLQKGWRNICSLTHKVIVSQNERQREKVNQHDMLTIVGRIPMHIPVTTKTSGNQTSRPRLANYRSRNQWRSTRQNQQHHTNARHHNDRRPLTSTTQNGNEWQQCEQQKNETDYWCTYCIVYGHSNRQCRGYY